MPMPGRTYSSGSYRYGFNGQEKSDEIAGVGNHNTAEFWEYDPRLGRRWNIDPVVSPNESPYAAFSNNPVLITDISGAAGGSGSPTPGSGTDREVNAAYQIVKKHFVPDPRKNRTDISEQLKADALAWFTDEYNPDKNPEYANMKVGAYSNFETLVTDLWKGAIASSFFNRYELNNKTIEAMSTESGKALATKALIGNDLQDFSFFFDAVIPSVKEFIGIAALGSTPALTGLTTNAARGSTFNLTNSSKLFSDIPQGASKLLGQRGEDLTELMIRRAYPNAIIAKQVTYKMSRYVSADCDFVVINEGQIVAIFESKVNGAVMSSGQQALFLERQSGLFSGKAADQFGLSGRNFPANASLKEIRYNSTTGGSSIINH